MSMPSSKRRQQGAALIVTLILLILVSLIGIGGYLATTGEVRSAAGWSDRQRALYLAESTMQMALTSARLLAQQSNVRSAVLAKGQGYYVRDQGTLHILPWNEATFEKNAYSVSNIAGMAGTSGSYIVVYEGMATSGSSGGVVSVNGSKNTTTQHARFTIYAKAGGQRDGTLVVLSTAQELY